MIVRKVDHVFVPLAAPEATFGFLTETLGLPVAWPFTEYGPFASGGVSLGSINLEVVRSSDPLPCFVARDPARVQGIAFEPLPIDDALLAELDRRGIPHSSPAPFPGTGHGTTGLLWTNVFFTDFVDERTIVFLCDYHVPEVRDVPARRAALSAAGGGRLGLEDVAEIVVGARDPIAAAVRWQRLLAPLRPREPGGWAIGDGPALRIAATEEDAVARLVLRVRSPDAAAEALGGRPETGGGWRVRPAALGGLELALASSV